MDQLTQAGLVSLVVTGVASGIIKYFFDQKLELYKSEAARSNQEALERFRDGLATNQKEQDARRDYEYEARKRLYEECEPLLFQLVELSGNAMRRIRSLARSARKGALEPGSGWLSSDGYYMSSTIYRLFAPLVAYRLIQRRLTLIDLTLDPYIAEQYRLAKCLYLSVTDDFSLAAENPAFAYAPDDEPPPNAPANETSRYRRQGLFEGVLDNVVEQLIVDERERPVRCKTFGEFSAEYADPASSLRRAFEPVHHLLNDFHPRTRPVTWRVLCAQALLYKVLLRARQTPHAAITALTEALALTDDEVNALDWRKGADEAARAKHGSLADAVDVPVAAARAQVLRRFADITKASAQ